MILKRFLESALDVWRLSTTRKPLLLRGARQVGKSSLVETFGARFFANTVSINFELEPQYKACFHTLEPKAICDAISVMAQQSIKPSETLLFLDEIQDCPQAIQALRYFKERMPALHVIGAGSLLELKLKEAKFRMPVGRVQFLYLYPLTFKEYLLAANQQAVAAIEAATLETPVMPAIHEYLLQQLHVYMLLGGLPEVIADYLETQSIENVQQIQTSILTTYQQDFSHYAPLATLDTLHTCFNRIPLMIGQQIKYHKIDEHIRSRELKQALAALEAGGILERVLATTASGLPLDASVNEKRFKLNFVDVGLVKRMNQLDAQLLLNADIMLLNKGALAEQFVGQELLAYGPNYDKIKSYYWARDQKGSAEVDYVKVFGPDIFPIEVKAGKVGRLRSLHQYLLEHDCLFGIRLSQQPLKQEDHILSVPLYMVSELERLVLSQTSMSKKNR